MEVNGAAPAGQEKVLDGIYQILKGQQAPAVIGQPVYERDLELLKFKGFSSLKDVFGQKVDENSGVSALPINFGSKHHTAGLPDDVRLRLFELKKMWHNVEVQAQIMYRGHHVTPAMMQETPIFKRHFAGMAKAYNITDFSSWIPTVNARFYFEEFEIPFMLADQFDQQPMDSATVTVPGDLGHLVGREETDAATFGVQSTTQANFTVTSRNNVCHTKLTEDLMQDSAPAYLEKLRRDLAKAIVRSYESAIINGDTTDTGGGRGSGHLDSDTAALALNATFLKAFDGIRRKAKNNDTTLGAGSIMYDHGGDTASKLLFEKVLGLMGKFATEKDDLRWIIPSVVENQLVTGAIPELFTAFAFGGLASNVTGQVPPVFGIKPVTSQYVRDDLNASGVYAAASTKTIIALVKVSRFSNFVRQAMRMWAAPSLPSSDEMLMTSKMRHAWNGNPQSATEKSITLGFNIARS